MWFVLRKNVAGTLKLKLLELESDDLGERDRPLETMWAVGGGKRLMGRRKFCCIMFNPFCFRLVCTLALNSTSLFNEQAHQLGL